MYVLDRCPVDNEDTDSNINETAQNNLPDAISPPGNYLIELFFLNGISYNSLEPIILVTIVENTASRTPIETLGEFENRFHFIELNVFLFI